MLTRCPACETHFRVTPEQLKARSGRVRCGECQHGFNALDSLIEEPMVFAAPIAPEPTSRSPRVELPAAGADSVGTETAVPPAPASDALDAGEIEAPDTQMPVPPEPATSVDAAIADPPEVPDWSETFPDPPQSPRRWPWVLGSMIALAAIGLQAVLAFRVELAVLSPDARSALVALCDMAGCEVGLPAKVALVGIETSDLHPDVEGKGSLVLTATLKNRAPFAQQFPYLELTLTDTADRALVRKVLAPADYLPKKASLVDGMSPNADIAVSIGVAPGDMTASGYRLYLFYP